MTLEIIRGTNSKPVATEELIELFRTQTEIEGQLIIGFPNLGGQPGDATADAIWLSRDHGAVLFDLVDGTLAGDYERRQEDIFRLFQSRLFQHRDLVRRRKLLVTPEVITFGPAITATNLDTDSESIVANSENLFSTLSEFFKNIEKLTDDLYTKLLSAAQSISSIRRGEQIREIEDENSMGGRLKELENSIATLDHKQHKAVIETIDGVQRIRGLAGSGKTIILALKAAYLHGRNPRWKIAVTFYTRSLKDQLVRLITTFCMEQTGSEPNWENIHIVNAWGGYGGPDRSGMYLKFCQENNTEYFDLRNARDAFGSANAFNGAVVHALEQAPQPESIYDLILVDEAQDFPPAFLRMCYWMLGPQRRMVYAYDELQSLSGESLPDSTEIFGLDENGNPRVTFERDSYDLGARRDIVLEKCYRNSRPVLVSAHAIGFGIYRRPRYGNDIGLVQMFDQGGLWNDIGYQLAEGVLEPERQVRLVRTNESSPLFLENHSPIDDLIKFQVFNSKERQNDWVASQIIKNIQQDELRHTDIMVINPNPFTARKNFGEIRSQLHDAGYKTHIAGVDLSADIFFTHDRESITFTGINRAKGNESGMVYVVNAHEGNDARANLGTIRNRLFTAITRSKAWVRVCGYGPEMKSLADEFRSVRSSDFALDFTYPNEEQRSRLQILHRDIASRFQRRTSNASGAMREFFRDVKDGNAYPEDLDPDLLEELRTILGEQDVENE